MIIKFLLLLTVFLTPLIGASGGFGYEQSKVVFFIVCNTLIGFLWVLSKPKIKWANIKIASSLFIFCLLLTSILGINLKLSILGSPPYFQGLILYSQLYLFSLVVSTVKISFKTYARALLLSSTIVALLSLKDWVSLEYLHQYVPTYAGRVVSSFGQPNFYSGFILLTLPFISLLPLRLWFLGAIILMVAIFVSQSRIAILLAAIVFSFLILQRLNLLRFKKMIFIPLLLIFLGSSAMLLEGPLALFQKEVTQTQSNQWLIDNSPEKRIFIWPIILELISQRVAFGYGLENMGIAFTGYFENINFNTLNNPLYHSLKDLFIDRSHNFSLDLLFFSGGLGLGAWIILIIMLFYKLLNSEVKMENTALLLSLSIYLAWVQFQNQSLVHLIYFWLMVGIIDRG